MSIAELAMRANDCEDGPTDRDRPVSGNASNFGVNYTDRTQWLQHSATATSAICQLERPIGQSVEIELAQV